MRCTHGHVWFLGDCLIGMQVSTDFLNMSKDETLPKVFKQHGWREYLLCPPVDDPRNLIDTLLSSAYCMVGCGVFTVPCTQRNKDHKHICKCLYPDRNVHPLPLPHTVWGREGGHHTSSHHTIFGRWWPKGVVDARWCWLQPFVC